MPTPRLAHSAFEIEGGGLTDIPKRSAFETRDWGLTDIPKRSAFETQDWGLAIPLLNLESDRTRATQWAKRTLTVLSFLQRSRARVALPALRAARLPPEIADKIMQYL